MLQNKTNVGFRPRKHTLKKIYIYTNAGEKKKTKIMKGGPCWLVRLFGSTLYFRLLSDCVDVC